MDAGVSCLGVAPQSALLSQSQSFADAAIARALHFSLSDACTDPSAPAATAVLTRGDASVAGDCPPTGGAAAARSSPARSRLGPAGGHAGKRRRPRPSKRAPTTYISTDAATFRVMVQRVTGADEADLQQHEVGAAGLGLGLLLPQLGVEQFLPVGPASHVAAAYAAAVAPSAGTAPAAADQPPLFPTLDSWNVMYGKKNEVV